MTSLPAPTSQPTAPLPGVLDARQWCPIDTAAERLGVSVGHLRRQCSSELAAGGLARRGRPAEGGAARWYVQRAYDRRLLPGNIGELYCVDQAELDRHPKAKVDQARARMVCVQKLREARSTWPGAVSTWLPRLIAQLQAEHPALKLSQTSLYRWDKLAPRLPADLPKLIDTRGGNRRGEPDPAAWAHFRALYLDQNRRTIKSCWRDTRDYCQANDLRWITYTQCVRKVDADMMPAEQAAHRDPALFRGQFEPYLPMDPERWEPGLCWIGDHAQLDLWARFGKRLIRPWLTAWMDWRSRRIVGYVLTDSPNSSTILASLRHGLMDPANHGGPDELYLDNGKDYACSVFHGQTKRERQVRRKLNALDESAAAGLLGMLSIAVHFAIPYNAKAKGRLERWFYTMHDQFDKTWETYCGRNTQERPERLAAVLRAPNRIPTFADVSAGLDQFIADYNASCEHSKDDMEGLSPDDVMARCPRIRSFANPQVLSNLLMFWDRPTRVHRNGVSIKPMGKTLSYGATDTRLNPYKGAAKQVRVSYDPRDLRTVRVWTLEGKLICEAKANDHGLRCSAGEVDRNALGEAMKRKRQYVKATRQAKADAIAAVTPAGTLATHQARQRREKPVVAADQAKPLTLVRTPVDPASKPLQNEAARQAAGAETDPQPPARRPMRSLSDLVRSGRARPSTIGRITPSLSQLVGPGNNEVNDE